MHNYHDVDFVTIHFNNISVLIKIIIIYIEILIKIIIIYIIESN